MKLQVKLDNGTIHPSHSVFSDDAAFMVMGKLTDIIHIYVELY